MMMGGMMILWVVVLLLIVWFARGSFYVSPTGRRESPLEVLDRRLAEGAISEEEYQERREVLTTPDA